MIDRTFFIDREVLYRIFGGDPLAVRKFETLQETVAVSGEATSAGVSATQTLRDATFVTLSANAELTGERVLFVGPGLSLDTGTEGRVTLRSNVVSDNGHVVQFNVLGPTVLQLPTAGIVATLGGVETFSNKTLNAPKASGLTNAADDAAAASAGVPVGGIYRDGSNLKVRVS